MRLPVELVRAGHELDARELEHRLEAGPRLGAEEVRVSRLDRAVIGAGLAQGGTLALDRVGDLQGEAGGGGVFGVVGCPPGPVPRDPAMATHCAESVAARSGETEPVPGVRRVELGELGDVDAARRLRVPLTGGRGVVLRGRLDEAECPRSAHAARLITCAARPSSASSSMTASLEATSKSSSASARQFIGPASSAATIAWSGQPAEQ